MGIFTAWHGNVDDSISPRGIYKSQFTIPTQRCDSSRMRKFSFDNPPIVIPFICDVFTQLKLM